MLLSPLLSLHYKRKHALGTHAQDQVQPRLRRDLSTVELHNFHFYVCLKAIAGKASQKGMPLFRGVIPLTRTDGMFRGIG